MSTNEVMGNDGNKHIPIEEIEEILLDEIDRSHYNNIYYKYLFSLKE
jgi:hypothetical protein